MKNKLISKRLVISSIILLLLTAPILTSAELNKNTHPTSLNIYANNSLGTATVDHQPGLFGILKNRGALVTYDPPANNPSYNYYFPEDENGTVFMNFTLHVKHRLNDIGIYWLEKIWPTDHRWTFIKIWVSWNGNDVIKNETKKLCVHKDIFEPYNITVSAPIITNGTTQKCILWITATPLYTNISIIQDICKQIFSHKVVSADIYINPT